MSFGQPLLALLTLLAPLYLLAALACWRRHGRAAAAWAGRPQWARLLPGWSAPRQRLSSALVAAALAACGLALAQPRWGSAVEEVERRGADVVVVLDTSLSMAATDVRPSRLDVARALVRRLVAAQPENRFALVQMEGEGFGLAPLTRDGAVISLLLDTVAPGSLPTPGTALGPALDRALELFGPGGDSHRAVVVLSDGEDHEGGFEARVETLVRAGVTAHAFGVGTRLGAPVPAAAGDAFKLDAEGQPVVSRLEEEPLRRLAEATGGTYLSVEQAAADPAPILDRLAAPGDGGTSTELVERAEERFQWPLALAAAVLALHLAARPRRGDSPWLFNAVPYARTLATALLSLTLLGAQPAPRAEGPPPQAAAARPSEAGASAWLYNPRQLTGRAASALGRGEPGEAVTPAHRALDLAPADSTARYNAGTVLAAAGEEGAGPLLEAAARAGTAAEDTDLAADAWYNLGNAEVDARRWQAAVAAYREALRARPGDGDAKFNLEWALRKLQEQQEQQDQPSPPSDGEDQGTPPEDQAGDEETAGGKDSQGEGSEGESQGAAGEPPPRFEGQQDLDGSQAEALLQAVENLEREQRAERARQRAAEAPEGTKDW